MKVIIGVIGGVVVVIVALLAFSFDSLEYNEYGLDYASISKTIDPTPYTSGIHYLGLGHSFIRFPRNVQTVEFSSDRSSDHPPIQSRTKDGLEVTLEISFQFVLKGNSLYNIYMYYEKQYRLLVVNTAVDTLTDIATKYNAYDFFQSRAEIGNTMMLELDKALSKKMYCAVEFFQLRDVDLPDPFENAIQLSEVKKQDIHKATAERNRTEVELNTKIMQAEYRKQININQAEGDAQGIIQTNKAEVNAFNATEFSTIEGYARIKKEVGLTNAELLVYMKSKIIDNYEGKKLAISFEHN